MRVLFTFIFLLFASVAQGQVVNWTNGRGDSGTGPVVGPNWTITNTPLRSGINNVTVTDPISGTSDSIVITYVPTFPGTTLAGAWSFSAAEGSGAAITDATVNGNNGSLINGASRTTGPHTPDQAITLNGTNQYANVSDSNTLDFTQGFTFSAWVNVAAVHSDYRPIIVKNTVIGLYASENQYCPVVGRPMIWFNSNGTIGPQYYACGSNALNTGVWMHLAGTYDGTSLKLYIDGGAPIVNVIGPPTQYMEPTTGTLTIGASTSSYFDGQIASPRVYNWGIPQAGTLNVKPNGGCTTAQRAESISAPSVIGDMNCTIANPIPPLTIKIPASATGLKLGAAAGGLKLGATP